MLHILQFSTIPSLLELSSVPGIPQDICDNSMDQEALRNIDTSFAMRNDVDVVLCA